MVTFVSWLEFGPNMIPDFQSFLDSAKRKWLCGSFHMTRSHGIVSSQSTKAIPAPLQRPTEYEMWLTYRKIFLWNRQSCPHRMIANIGFVYTFFKKPSTIEFLLLDREALFKISGFRCRMLPMCSSTLRSGRAPNGKLSNWQVSALSFSSYIFRYELIPRFCDL